MADARIIKDFDQCPICHGPDTVCRQGCGSAVKAGRLSKDAFLSLDKIITPLEQPMLAAVTVEAIMCHFDVCLDCGTRYCTRAELIHVPVSFQIPGGDSGKQFPGFRR